MKRFWILGFAVLMCVLTGMEALAAVDMGGSVALDVYYYKQDKAGFGRGRTLGTGTPGTGGYAGINDANPTKEDDRSSTFVDFNRSSSFWLRWQSEGGMGLYISPYLKGDANQSSGTEGLNVGISIAYGWWDITPKFKIAVGKGNPEVFSPMDPGTSMGYDGVGKVLGIGYGNFSSKYQNGAVFTYKFNEMISANLAFLESRLTDPNNTNYTSMNPGFKKNVTGAYVDNVTKIPRIEASIPLTFGKVKVIPSAMWMKQTFDNVAGGADDSITSWGASLGGEVVIGALTLKGEAQTGQNWFNATKVGVSTCYPFKSEYVGPIAFAMSAKADAAGKIYDSDNTAFWGQATIRIGRFLPTAIYGRMLIDRDIPGLEANIRTQMYGVNCPIILTSNLILIPEIMIYDGGGSNKFVSAYAPASSQIYDCGKELLAGVQFRFLF